MFEMSKKDNLVVRTRIRVPGVYSKVGSISMENREEMFRSIYMGYLPLVRTIVKKFLIPDDDIEDVTQEVFVSFYRTYELDKPDDENRKLLARISNNCCLDYKRRQKTHPEFSCDPMVIQSELLADSFLSSDSLTILLKKQEYERIASVLRTLKREWADVFRLHVIEGRPMNEVAEILGVAETACRMRLLRGRKHLRKVFQKQWEAESQQDADCREVRI